MYARRALRVPPPSRRIPFPEDDEDVWGDLGRLLSVCRGSKALSPHALRHTAGALLFSLGADLGTVAEMLRHSDLNTTRRYTRLVDERRRDAVPRLEVTIPKEILPITGSPAGTGLSQNTDAPVREVATDVSSPPTSPVAPDSLDVENDLRDAA